MFWEGLVLKGYLHIYVIYSVYNRLRLGRGWFCSGVLERYDKTIYNSLQLSIEQI